MHWSSSVAGFKPGQNFSIYSISKAALLTRNMAVELGPHNIRVYSINPRILSTSMTLNTSLGTAVFQKLYTDMIPLRGLVDIKDVVDATMYLLSEQSRMITGVTLTINGGSSL